MVEEMCEYIANGTGYEVYGNGEFHRKLQEGTEIKIQESGRALVLEQKRNYLYYFNCNNIIVRT
ncbi:hypothetical protein C0J52_21849 [Blattella germanica]|nr:hypothetical protein C0J52_21849 [Blattella germanica]